jgi:uncharacterized protein (TIGR03435 family)
MKQRKLVHGLVATSAAIVLAGAGTAWAARLQEQAATTKAEFEAASIKPNRSGSGGHHWDFSNGRLVAVNVTTKTIIRQAYGVADGQLVGVPDWVNSEFYDINAKMDDAAAAALEKLPLEERNEKDRQLFQNLLTDRFGLKVAHETNDLPIFALVVSKGGIKFSPTKLPPEDAAGTDSSGTAGQPERGTSISGNGRETSATCNGVKMSAWAAALSRQPEVEGRLVLDQTGLTGEYDFAMKWARQRESDFREGGGGAPVALDTSGPSLFTALQEQLGLKLEAKKGPVDTIVIVHIERPSEN